jgi:HD superfamily phosphohydrolase
MEGDYMERNGVHIINDPIHGVMPFTNNQKNIIKKIIDDRVFQRLRRIKQLGCGDLIFPGAVHTRFNHMLGVCYLAKKIASYLVEERRGNQSVEEIMVSGLLHDVGHGPFSHAFEKVFIADIDKIKGAKINHDEDWLRKFLEYFRALILPDFDFSKVESILLKKLKAEEKFKSDIISSQLDVDRMDYLLRDSHFCGVPYGKIDLKWLLSCMKLWEVNNEQRLCISKKGIGALENYINARRLMTKYIYYHGKKNASEYYIRIFLEMLCKLADDIHIKHLPLVKFLKLYSEYIDKIKKFSTNDCSSSVNDEKMKFINVSFEYYRVITDDDVWSIINYFSAQKINNVCYEIAERLLTRNLPYSYLLNPAREHEISKIVESFKSELSVNERWKIHIGKLDLTSYITNKEPIYILDGTCVMDTLHESSLLNLLSNRSESRYYLYIDKLLDKKIIKKLLLELNQRYCFESPVKYENDGDKSLDISIISL